MKKAFLLLTLISCFSIFGKIQKTQDDKTIGLFNFYRKYNQREVEDALIKANLLEDHLIPENLNAIWNFPGKLDAFGINLHWFYQFSPYWEIGSSIYFLKSRSKLEFNLENENQYNLDKINDLTKAKNTALQANGIKNLTWDKTGFGDLDFYLRLGASRDYFLKCRKIGTGMKLGVVVPTGVEINLNNPASVPFGNGGFWATYVDLGIDTELKVNLPKTKKGWATEHITATGIYDFGYMNECLSSTPRVFLDIDIPVNIIASKNANKTYGIGLRIESSIW